jgi:putative DNA methylase
LWQRRHAAWQAAQASGDTSVAAPGEPPTLEGCAADLERERLFDIIRELVKWENTTNEAVLRVARDEIWQSWRRACADNAGHPRAAELFRRDRLPAFHDPFAGGGALPLEAQRLGLEAHATDLNPVAVLINKAMIEIPPRFACQPPVNPEARRNQDLAGREWKGAQGLAEDVRYYGQWIRDEAKKRIGHLYPQVEVTAEMAKERPDLKPYVGQKLTVIAWLWVRTVKSPNPAFADVEVPLASTFMISAKAGREAFVDPVIRADGYRFSVRVGVPKDAEAAKNGTKLARGANFKCLMSGTPIAGDYIKAEGKAGRLGAKMMAVIAEGVREKVYLSPTAEAEALAGSARPDWEPSGSFVEDARAFTPCIYGIREWRQLFSPRQTAALSTFADLAWRARSRVEQDAIAAAHRAPAGDSSVVSGRLGSDGPSALAYATSVVTYLGLAVGRCANYWSSQAPWGGEFIVQTFGRQALQVVWDYAEGNPFSASTGNWSGAVEWVEKVLEFALPATPAGVADQADAQSQSTSSGKVVSTDPPYYDNVPYADLSDFFYVWLRRALKEAFPEIFATLAVPKMEELVATSYRHGGKKAAETFFLDGMTKALGRLASLGHPAFPVTIYYAFKQAETESEEGTASTGWETFLAAVIEAGFGVSGTWPARTERSGGFRNRDRSSLATSIVLVCHPRPASAPTATRRQFVAALKAELPEALGHLQRGNIAPVDLAQAAIGPGMAVFTRFAKVLGADDRPLSVREALSLINQTLDEALAEQEGDFDADSRWAITWFDENGFADGEYGCAEQLSKSKNTSVEGMRDAGILTSSRGKVRILKPEELGVDWDPTNDTRLSAWETVHHLMRALATGGDAAAATLVAKLGGARADAARELAYRLYMLCERKKRAAEALGYNALVQSWPEIVRMAAEQPAATTGEVVDQANLL